MKSRLSQRLGNAYLTIEKEQEILNKAVITKAKIDELANEIDELDKEIEAKKNRMRSLQEHFDRIEEEFESPDPETMDKLLAIDVSTIGTEE